MKKKTSLRTFVTEHGRVTIPKILRDKVGILPGTVVKWQVKDNKAYLTKARASATK